MNGWAERLLACAGRETLIKSVIQAIPTFSMSCFRLTKKVCKGLAASMAKFWWSGSLDRRSMHWLSWEKLASPKCQGGMGFRDLELFNLALLGKHGWRFITNPNSLCAQVMKGRYFPDCDFMEASVPHTSSAIWRAIIAGREALHVGLIKRVGDGSTISIWEDKWIPGLSSLSPTVMPGGTTLATVGELIDHDNGTWRRELIYNVFIRPDADAILNIPLRRGGGDDFRAWVFERSGNYSVKSAYRALVTRKERLAQEEGAVTNSSQTDERMWKSLWKLRVLPKVRVFWWRVIRRILPDECTLRYRHIKAISRCNG